MELPKPPASDAATRLSLALVASSKVPLVLLADELTVVGASASFCSAFGIDPASVNGTSLSALGSGEWCRSYTRRNRSTIALSRVGR